MEYIITHSGGGDVCRRRRRNLAASARITRIYIYGKLPFLCYNTVSGLIILSGTWWRRPYRLYNSTNPPVFTFAIVLNGKIWQKKYEPKIYTFVLLRKYTIFLYFVQTAAIVYIKYNSLFYKRILYAEKQGKYRRLRYLRAETKYYSVYWLFRWKKIE